MKNPKIKDSAVQHVSRYVDARLRGANKQESALQADYSEATARTPSLIENTKAYAVVIQRVLATTASNMDIAQAKLREELEKDEINMVKATFWANLAQTQAKTADILTPKITVKETKDAHGNVTRQSWGTNGAVVGDNNS